jgi:hypothetical protein
LQIDSLDNAGRRILFKRWKNTLDEDSTYSIEQSFYTPTYKIAKKIEKVTYFKKENDSWKWYDSTKTEKTYFYTAFDSLEKIIFQDFSNLNSTVLEKNNYNKKQQLQETIYSYSSGESHKLYVYDKLGKLSIVKMESRKSIKDAWQLDSKTEFTYENGKLSTEITASYYNGVLSSKFINNYENELLKTSKEIDKNGKVVEIVNYQYLFY